MAKNNKKTNLLKKIPLYVYIEVALIIAVICAFGYYYLGVRADANNTPPVISIEQGISNEFSVKATEEDLLNGVIATDEEDGNVTDSIIIESISKFVDKNTRTVTYVAFDNNNNVTKFERDIVYTDYTPPVFGGKSHIYVKTGSAKEILSKLTATDVIDGDISNQIKIEVNNVRTGVPDNYSVQITVTNSCGDVVSRDIVVTVTGEEDYH